LKAQEKLSGPAIITSIVEGREVWTPSRVQYSRNPAWIVYDLLTNTRYGLGIPTTRIDLDSFIKAADHCDALVDGEPRFTLDYVVEAVIEGHEKLLHVLEQHISKLDGVSDRLWKVALNEAQNSRFLYVPEIRRYCRSNWQWSSNGCNFYC